MAKVNKYIAERDAMRHGFFEAGLQMGRQQIIDMMSLVLHDPDIMGKDTFGQDRLLKVVIGIDEYIDTYQKAWEKDDETDYYRAKMDENLEKAYGKEMFETFDKRYDYCCDYDYVKGKWKR